jgi:hypothetical protein
MYPYLFLQRSKFILLRTSRSVLGAMMSSRLARGHQHRTHSNPNRLHGRNLSLVSCLLQSYRRGLKVAALAHQVEQQQQQGQQQLIAIPLRLGGRAVAILWDLDNIAPSSLQLDLLPAVQELQVGPTYKQATSLKHCLT